MRQSLLLKSLVLAGSLTLSGEVASLATDRAQPIEVEADYVEVDDRLGVAVYRGDVIVTQGTIRFTGKTLTMTYTENRELKESLLEGTPATYRQRMDGGGVVAGEATRMRYEAKKELIHLIEKAKVVRAGQIYTGHHMTYDVTKDLLTARKAEPGDRGLSATEVPPEDDRVRIVIPPEKKGKGDKR